MKTPFSCMRVFAQIMIAAVAVVMFFGLPRVPLAEEGMWTFDNPPLKLLKEKYGFAPTTEWLDHLRLASVRFNDGGSGSFVSGDGLVLTNHHVVLDQLQKLSSAKKDYGKDGYYAPTPGEELKCPDLELNVLMSMENVTARVQGAAKPGQSPKDALDARRAEIARIEKESLDKTGLRSDVVTLYLGGEYWLYRYKKYTEVRIVFAPEQQIAFFGGDPDNFTYPRYDLDFAIFRAYENGQPVHPAHFLKWNSKGAGDGELVFVSGHPGSTSRLDTLVRLEYTRDQRLPLILETYKRQLTTLRAYAARGEEQARQARDLIFGLENSLKAEVGQLQGLQDKNLMAKKEEEEREFRASVEGNAVWKQAYGDAWEKTAAAIRLAASSYKRRFHRSFGFSNLPALAQSIVQYVAEVAKPDAERLPGFHESQLESLRFELFSPAPVYPELDRAILTSWWEQGIEMIGADDEFFKAALGGRAAADVVREVMSGTKLGDQAVRKALVEGGPQAVEKSSDPLIALARRIDPIVREQQKWAETNIEGPLQEAGEKIGKARFTVYGKSVSPDATFTLRLSFGVVKGYPMNGTMAPPWTTLYGLYDRNASFGGKPPFNLPERFLKMKDRLDLSTPVNFVTTNDIIGGNSGSPVVNRNGELVGLIFDGNIESLVGDLVYTDEANRAVAVHPAFIIEALRKLYGATALADQLEGRHAETAR